MADEQNNDAQDDPDATKRVDPDTANMRRLLAALTRQDS
jgi:hypothetical protein